MSPSIQRLTVAGVFLICGGLVACAPEADSVVGEEETSEAVVAYEPEEVVPTRAFAQLSAAEGLSVGATVTFNEVEGGVWVVGEVIGAEPGSHGFHLHETGDCSSADFKSSGGHFNPTEVAHAGPEAIEHHAGDWGNLEVGEDGSGRLELTTSILTVGDGANSVVGRAVVLHGGTDDLTSQPSGAAGPRIACGVVELGSLPIDENPSEESVVDEEAAGESEAAETQ